MTFVCIQLCSSELGFVERVRY